MPPLVRIVIGLLATAAVWVMIWRLAQASMKARQNRQEMKAADQEAVEIVARGAVPRPPLIDP